MRTYGDMPPNPAFPVSESDRQLVLHARLLLDGMELMCADSREKSTAGDNMYVSITVKDASYVQKAWDTLRQDGQIYMELAPSFFAVLHGSLRDRFGINWMFTALK
jgi:PhnB protein